MIAGNGGRGGESGPDRRTQDRRPRHRESGLTQNQRQCAGDNANEQRAHDASATIKRQHADADGNEKRDSIDCASANISQQNKPRPTVLSTSPRTSMVVAPFA